MTTKDKENDQDKTDQKELGFWKRYVFKPENIISLTGLFILTTGTVYKIFFYYDEGILSIIYSITIMLFIVCLLIILIQKETNFNKLLNRNIELNENNKFLEITNGEKIKRIEKLNNLVEDIDYMLGQHSLRILKNYASFSSIIDKIHKLQEKAALNFESVLDISNLIDQKKLAKKFASENKKIAQEICKDIANFLVKTGNRSDREVTVSLFLGFILEDEAEAFKFCAASSRVIESTESLKTESKTYPIINNTDFLEICEYINDGQEQTFYCRNNLTYLDEYKDSNHVYLCNQPKLYRYKKEMQYLLPYKSLISSAIFDVNNRSFDSKKVSGFLTVSSPKIDSFTRSDTLVLQVIALQLHDLCIFLK